MGASEIQWEGTHTQHTRTHAHSDTHTHTHACMRACKAKKRLAPSQTQSQTGRPAEDWTTPTAPVL